VAGLDDLAVRLSEVSARLKDAGEGGLSRALAAAIGKAVEPLEREVRDGLAPRLPNRYAEVIGSELDIFRRTFSDPDGARVTVYARTGGSAKRKLRRLDDGILWHPLWGDRKEWREQQVGPGWFSGPARDAAPAVRQEIGKAIDDAVAKAARP
jgi:hypothetical protein